MISDQLSRRIHELTERGEAFVTATVVRAQRPTSAEPGSVAVVRGDGTIEGFVGGVCAEQSVRLYSLRAIDEGEPMLLRILPESGDGDAGEEGAVTVKNPCLSGGAIEIFLEPLLPAPRVRVAGESLIADAVRRLAPELGLELADAARPAQDDLALVVAAHGRGELDALRAGLEAVTPYVGLVASPRRGRAVLDELRADGVSDELLARIDTPAGLDIGARTPAEIALSILARIVEVRRGHRASGSATAGAAAAGPVPTSAGPRTATDPICGMTVVVSGDTPSIEHDGRAVYFCGEGCRRAFEQQTAA